MGKARTMEVRISQERVNVEIRKQQLKIFYICKVPFTTKDTVTFTPKDTVTFTTRTW